MRNTLLLLLISAQALLAQKSITNEDIWRLGTFRPKFVPGFNFMADGRHYTRNENGSILSYDIETGQSNETLIAGNGLSFEDYSFSPDEQYFVFEKDAEEIYRHSYKANVTLYHRTAKKSIDLSKKGKIAYQLFSPDGSKIAYCRDNNLFFMDLKTEKETQVTNDGKWNNIINGSTDWVYEEEFSFTRAFDWSADSKKLAFMKFDESQVPQFTMDMYEKTLYPKPYTFKYPKAGEKNAVVTVFIFDVDKKKNVEVALDAHKRDQYIPRMQWTRDPNKLCVWRMNRHQNELELLGVDAKSGKTSVMLKETNEAYIDVHDELYFMADGKTFLWMSEKDGFNHAYIYTTEGKLVQQITNGKWDVTEIYGVDETNKKLYFQSAEKNSSERYVYSINLDGTEKKKLSPETTGVHNGSFSSTFSYFINTYSSADTPPVFGVYKNDGKLVRELENNSTLKTKLVEYNLGKTEFFSLTTDAGAQLNAYSVKPANFDPNKKYPVLMFVYGGPGHQTVMNQWDGSNRIWFQMLAQKGYVVVSVDNRGTGGRGEAFKKCTYKQLGKLEAEDQIGAGKWLAKQPWVDGSRIGIWGWSFGGYMSSLCILKGADVFKMAMAVAPVTNWKWYDTIYTERFLQTPAENPSGYEDNSPVNYAEKLKGKYLLIHGMADDNVHFQNAVEMAGSLIAKNKQFDTYFYPNQNHGIGMSRLHLFTKMTDFVLENL